LVVMMSGAYLRLAAFVQQRESFGQQACSFGAVLVFGHERAFQAGKDLGIHAALVFRTSDFDLLEQVPRNADMNAKVVRFRHDNLMAETVTT
jgi:hypothetical protein